MSSTARARVHVSGARLRERSQQAVGLDPKAVEWTIILLGLGLSVLLLAQNDRKKPLAYLVGFAVLTYIVVSGALRG
jgi:hypothetical protein